MQFNSFIFILFFLPTTTILYHFTNKFNLTFGKIILLISSIVFYAYSGQTTLIVLGSSLTFNFLFAKLLEKTEKWHRFFLFTPVLINIALLFYFKYLNFAIENINFYFFKEIPLRELTLPVGISFFTFQQIAYIVAIYKRDLKKNSVIDYLVYILFFPKLLMGPLTDPIDFSNQLNDPSLKKVNWENLAYGIKIFSFGLFKKVMIADIFNIAVSWGYSNIETATSMDLILVMLFYTFEIYFDFSGYSDMAVGSSLLFNITLPINFDSPYKALSIRDFWKRWHISLTKFFTKYVYIPLGGNKKGLLFTCINTMTVFLISGLWHGANWTFILWGGLHGILSLLDRIFDKYQQKIAEPVRWTYTFITINILWLLFRSDTILQWAGILKRIILFQNTNVSDGLINVFILQESSFVSNILRLDWLTANVRGFWMIIYILISYGICLLFENNYRKMRHISAGTMIIAAAAFVWGFICLSHESVFVYFNF